MRDATGLTGGSARRALPGISGGAGGERLSSAMQCLARSGVWCSRDSPQVVHHGLTAWSATALPAQANARAVGE